MSREKKKTPDHSGRSFSRARTSSSSVSKDIARFSGRALSPVVSGDGPAYCSACGPYSQLALPLMRRGRPQPRPALPSPERRHAVPDASVPSQCPAPLPVLGPSPLGPVLSHLGIFLSSLVSIYCLLLSLQNGSLLPAVWHDHSPARERSSNGRKPDHSRSSSWIFPSGSPPVPGSASRCQSI